MTALDPTVGNLVVETETHGPLRSLLAFLGASWLNRIAVGIVLLVVFLALFGELVAPYGPDKISLLARLAPPSPEHLFGTDHLGRDLFSRVLAGARVSMLASTVVLTAAVSVGTLAGIVAGVAGGWIDEAVMRLTDLFLAFPALILAAAVAAAIGPSLVNTMLALSTVFWPWYARLVRGQVLSLREREFVLAARLAGAGTRQIMWRHMLRNVAPIVAIQATIDVGYAILLTSSLSFLGLGVRPPTAEWGAMMGDAIVYVQHAWWYATFTGLALAITVFAFNLLGDGLRDWLDPRRRTRI
jgi:peptide/nickel transport system permease protein